jgi:hypothetical protein
LFELELVALAQQLHRLIQLLQVVRRLEQWHLLAHRLREERHLLAMEFRYQLYL